MQTQDFAKFVESQQESSEEVQVDWAAIRDEWLSRLESLYSQVLEFLKDFIAAGSIQCSFTDVGLNEENIGTYSARRMNIRIGRQYIYLEPVGTLLIGFAGRVDAVGPGGRRAQIALVDKRANSVADLVKVTVGAKPDTAPIKVNMGVGPAAPSSPIEQPISWVWKIVSRDARRTFIDLDRDSFYELLMELAGA